MRLVLLSNSTNFGGGYLDHALPAIAELFRGVRRVAFVPFALADQAGYFERARKRLQDLGIEAERIVEGAPGRRTIEDADGVFVGGGNTFRLLERLQRSGLLAPIRSRTLGGTPYLGASAGTVVAAPTIKTTNDMPIVQPASFEALGLVPFQINCHYLDPEPASRHMGETRETRLREYLEENDLPVVGLREGSWLQVEGGSAGAAGGAVGRENAGRLASLRFHLRGPVAARIFRRGAESVECPAGAALEMS